MSDPGVRLVVTRGGEPTPEQAAALATALSLVRPAPTLEAVAPGWRLAALREGVGGAVAVSAQPRDLWLRRAAIVR